MYTGLHRPATFIERALQNLKESLLIAAVLISRGAIHFLRNARAAFIAFMAIPLLPVGCGCRTAPPGSDVEHDDTRWIRCGPRRVG